MTPDALANLHARCFTSPPPWSARAFEDLLGNAHDFLIANAWETAFIAGRVIAGEAELLTLATDPDHRRQGLANALLARFDAEARERGASRVFLEVSETNTAARALYAAAGYAETGRRRGYYRQSDGTAVDAMILCKSLG